jgi:hypothetical protein
MMKAHRIDVYHIWQPLGKQQSFLVYSKELGYKNQFYQRKAASCQLFVAYGLSLTAYGLKKRLS